MNHHPTTHSSPLLPELAAELARIRAKRAFDPAAYLETKAELVASYLDEHSLHGTVLGMSGGIDSAVVLGILREVQRRFPAILTRIVPLCLPTLQDAVGQDSAVVRAKAQCVAWDVDRHVVDLRPTHAALKRQLEAHLLNDHYCSQWASGQLTSYIRTPALYFATSLLTDQGCPALVVGTTNRDEGSYLGYVGKASDGMVDLQLIADLHKSEVRALAKHLGVTQEILAAVPSGEMHDGRVDEEVFGAPYDFVELYLGWLCGKWGEWPAGLKLSREALDQFHALGDNLEALHRYNAHKYLVGSPAVHLNVLESAVPGGWTK